MGAHQSRSNYLKGCASSGQLCVVSGVAQSYVVRSSIKCAQQGCSFVPRLSPQKTGGGESLITSAGKVVDFRRLGLAVPIRFQNKTAQTLEILSTQQKLSTR